MIAVASLFLQKKNSSDSDQNFRFGTRSQNWLEIRMNRFIERLNKYESHMRLVFVCSLQLDSAEFPLGQEVCVESLRQRKSGCSLL